MTRKEPLDYKLTEEQAKKVEENHGLILKYLSMNNLSENAISDWYGVLSEMLCRAVCSYDESCGVTFSSYAFTCFDHGVWGVKKTYAKRNNYSVYSLDAPDNYYNDRDSHEYLIQQESLQTKLMVEDAVEKSLLKFSERDQEIIKHVISGYTLREVAEKFELTYQRVQQIHEKFQNAVRKQLTDWSQYR